jgi:transposase, IS6 family
MTEQHPFTWRHFQSEIILLCLRWSLRYALSYRDLEEMMLERGLHVDHTTIYRWVQVSASELDKRCRSHLKAWNDSWRVDETSIKIKKVWVSLSRAVDSQGNPIECFLSPTRDAEAAKYFFVKALGAWVPHISMGEEKTSQPAVPAAPHASRSAPRVITVDKNAAYPKAIAEIKAAGILPAHVELRQVKYRGNLIEQDHRFIKRLTKPGMGFFSDRTAWRTVQGYAGDEYDQERTSARRGKRRGERAGCPGRQALWSRCLH